LQQPSLDIALSVNANLMFHARLHGLDRADAQQRINDGLVDIGLQDAAQSVVRSLSGGNRRKVELLRAMLHRPSLLLMDEASVGLDIVSRQQLLLTVQRLQQRDGVAVLWTTHLAEEIPFANRVIILRDGLKRFDDSLRMLYAQTAQTEPEAAFLHILDNATPCTSKTDFQ
jgi:ABC-2 type transport system ATP-binding protein